MTTAALTRATMTFGTDGTPLEVHFNPASLRVTTTNQFDDKNPEQVSKPTSFKLDVELIFDCTETGLDIFEATKPIRDAASATGQGASASSQAQRGAGQDKAIALSPSLKAVTFEWGTTSYQGFIRIADRDPRLLEQ